MPLTADGAGGFGAVSATGTATDNAETDHAGAAGRHLLSLSGTAGAINFGAAASNQLIGGTQSFFVSADGNLLVGGSPGGFDLLLASPAASAVSNTAFQGFYLPGRPGCRQFGVDQPVAQPAGCLLRLRQFDRPRQRMSATCASTRTDSPLKI